MKTKKCYQKLKDVNECSPTFGKIVMREIPCPPGITNCIQSAPNIPIIN